MELAHTVGAIKSRRVRVTDHADEEAAAEKITLEEIVFSVLHGEVIEDYPSDGPYPSCLIFGETPSRVALHSVWVYKMGNGWAVLITVYRPDPQRWTDWRERKKPR